jgi:signal transduction histidine kinase
MDASGRVSWSRLAFGPWPLVPLPILLLGSLAYANRAILIAGTSDGTTAEYLRIALALSLTGIAITVLAITPMVIIGGRRNTLRWSGSHHRSLNRKTYLLTCAASGAIVGVAQVLSRFVAIDPVTGQGAFENVAIAFITSSIPAFVFIIAITSTVGYLTLRIRRQTDQLQRQVDQLERQQRLIIEADQHVRSEVAEALHDDVQGALLRATLRLTRVAETATGPEEARAVREIVADLETLRGSGVRAISRRLAPALSSVGLVGALDDLAATYAGSLDVRITIDEASERELVRLPQEPQLATYRIVEQALLNTAAHARAHSALISVTYAEGTVEVVVADDGQGPAGPTTPGHGSAIIDAWVAIIGGDWALEAGPAGGTRLRATLAAS